MEKIIVKEKRSDVVFKKLQHDIINGKYSPKSKFPSERDLLQEYSVSRVTIREAVNKLSQ